MQNFLFTGNFVSQPDFFVLLNTRYRESVRFFGAIGYTAPKFYQSSATKRMLSTSSSEQRTTAPRAGFEYSNRHIGEDINNRNE